MTIKESVLAELQNNKEIFISGEHLSSAMGVSRTAVWKAINSLREDGHLIEAVTNKGYMLLQDSRCSWHSLDGEVYHEVTL